MNASPKSPPPNRHYCPPQTRAARVAALVAIGTVAGTFGSGSARLGLAGNRLPTLTVGSAVLILLSRSVLRTRGSGSGYWS